MIEVDSDDYQRSFVVDFVEDILEKNKFTVRGRDSKHEWTVNQVGDNFYCNCPRFTIKRKPCKHVIKIMIHKKIAFKVNGAIDLFKSNKKPDTMQGDFTGNDFPDDLLINERRRNERFKV